MCHSDGQLVGGAVGWLWSVEYGRKVTQGVSPNVIPEAGGRPFACGPGAGFRSRASTVVDRR